MVRRFQHIGLSLVITDTEGEIFQFTSLPITAFENSEGKINEGTCIVIAIKPDGSLKYLWECTHLNRYDSVKYFLLQRQDIKEDKDNQFFVKYNEDSMVELAYLRIKDLKEYLEEQQTV